jgi:hypothetical protein
MGETILRFGDPDRNKRLRELRLILPGFDYPRWGLLEAVRASVAARAAATDNDSRSAAGFNAWNAPVRRLREVYRGFNGWEAFEEGGVEGIIHRDQKLKIIPVSTDEATCDATCSPRNRTPKGPLTKKNIDLNNQLSLFRAMNLTHRGDGYQAWELCIFDDGNDVRAELSLPIAFSASYFLQFEERIFLIDPGEWKKIAERPTDQPGDDIEPEVRRRK